MQSPILLIATNVTTFPCDALQRRVNNPIVRVDTRRSGLTALRKREFCLVLVEKMPAESDCLAVEALIHNAGAAPVLEIDLGSMTFPSLVHLIQCELRRAMRERAQARAVAIATLQGELRDSLSGLLLESQLALRSVDSVARPRLSNIVALARELSERLKLPIERTKDTPFTYS